MKLSKVNIHDEGVIEEGTNTLMVDFANQYIGGGCMGLAAVQEEILFLIFPEFLFCLMLFPVMLDNEAIVVNGLKRYSKYTGYAGELEFAGCYEDQCELNPENILQRTFTCIDALYLGGSQDELSQFFKNGIVRELNKALVGFQGSSSEKDQDEKIPVSTGNWGCGAFGGNVELKFLIQWMAATINDRDIEYYTFKDKKSKHLEEILGIYKDKTVKDVYQDLINYEELLKKKIDSK